MIVIYNNPNIHTIGLSSEKTPGIKNQIVFLPGKNTVEKKLWQEFETIHPTIFEALRDNEELEVFSDDSDKVDYYKLTKKETHTLIENTMNITELDEYMKTEESRKNGIRKDSISKIKKQIASLNEDFSKSASDKREKELKDAGKI